MLAANHPDPVNVISLRRYAEDDVRRLDRVVRAARRIGKPLFIGELGVPGAGTPAKRAKFTERLRRLDAHKIDIAALWVFDFSPWDGEWNITPHNQRAWQLRAMFSGAPARDR